MQKAHQWCQGSALSIFPFVIIIIFYKIEFCIGKACFVATSKLCPMKLIFSYLHIFNVELSLNSDHFKEPLNYLSLLSEITPSWGGRYSTQFKTHRIIFVRSCLAPLENQFCLYYYCSNIPCRLEQIPRRFRNIQFKNLLSTK